MPKRTPDPLPLDIDDLSDLPIFIVDWQCALERQVQRLDDEHNLTDGYFLVVAAHQLVRACHQYANHDPSGEVLRACDAFEIKHPNLTVLRNMLMHSDEYYRGTGHDPDSHGRRTFTYSMTKHESDWHLRQGGTAAGQCNLSKLAMDGMQLAATSLAAAGPGESWLEQIASGGEYQGRDVQT